MRCSNCAVEIKELIYFCPVCGFYLKRDVPLPLENLKLVFMRADLSGFTKMSEAMNAEDVMSLLSEIFDIFSKVIESHKGIVYDIIGDEVVAVFGFPKKSGFAPPMAVMAADEMLMKLIELNKREYLKEPIGLKIGMTMEPTSTFNVHKNLRDALIITMGFKKCQILQKNADNNTLYVCENLYQATKVFFPYTEVGEFVEDFLSVKAFEYKMTEN